MNKNFALLPNFGTLVKNKIMGKNTSISLGNHFEDFVEKSISKGRFQNASEVIRAGLRMLEEEENKVLIIRNAIQEGIDSGLAKDFDTRIHLAMLQGNKRANG